MVKHIILWKLKDEYNTPAVRQAMKENLERLQGIIPGLIELTVQIDSLPTSNTDVMLYSVFEDQAALADYAIHPDHVAAADTYVRPFTLTRSCMDFVVG